MSHKIHFFAGDLDPFCAELRSVGSTMGNAARTLPIRPWCGGGRSAGGLHLPCQRRRCGSGACRRRAAGAGIRTWVDKANLRGGDRWNDVIEETISRRNPYVVVLQSAALATRTSAT